MGHGQGGNPAAVERTVSFAPGSHGKRPETTVKYHEVIDKRQTDKDLDIIVDWTKKWQMKLNTDKCKVVHVGKNNGNNVYSMLGQKLQIVKKEKDLGIMISSDLKREEQCRYVANKANKVLGMVKKQ